MELNLFRLVNSLRHWQVVWLGGGGGGVGWGGGGGGGWEVALQLIGAN